MRQYNAMPSPAWPKQLDAILIASVPDDYATKYFWPIRVDAPLWPEQGPDMISGIVTMDHATFTTFLSLARGTFAVSVYLPRPTGYGIIANIYSVWMYIIPNETIQCDALSCLAETAGCDFDRLTQLAPGNLIRLDGSPALTGLDMVDTVPAYDGPNLSSCFVLSG